MRRVHCAVLFVVLAATTMGATINVRALPDDPASTEQDRKFMRRANALAAAAAANGNTSYGALLVNPDGTVLMEFGNDARTSGDVTHHAETGIISLACRKYSRETVARSVLYTSSEPCIMCCGAIRAARIKKFVYGTTSIQVARLRGSKVPDHPLRCREVLARSGSVDVLVLGPLLEAEGLIVHAEAMARLPAAGSTTSR